MTVAQIVAESVRARAQAWALADPDPVTRAELEALIEAGNEAELQERMLGELEFGTAGLRGVVGAGSARMNLAVVVRITRALAEQLLSRTADARTLPVVVAGDARLDSQRFADAAARVLLAAGIPVKRFAEPVPTPLLAYAVRAFAANAGVMITASHNPAEYNGYKLYWSNGVQVVPPTDHELIARLANVGAANQVPLADLAGQELIGEALTSRYLADIQSQLPRVVGKRELCIVYTPMHGVGGALVERSFREAGYRNFYSVAAQREPDGHFPTLPFPNPEEPGALDLAIALATEKRADLLIANDPDADRLAIALPTPSGLWQALTGNQIGLLLADFALSHSEAGARSLVLCSLVSSPMVESIAASHGAHCERVLTGFKWVWTAGVALEERGLRYSFGFEEALGYSFGRAVRDKDGISAALAFAELAVECQERGQSLLDRLHLLYRKHGLWVSVQHNVVLKGAVGAARITQAMQELAANPPTVLAGREVVNVRDLRRVAADAPSWRGAASLIELQLAGSVRVFVRPSGTEPKLKLYVDLLTPLLPSASITATEAAATDDARGIAIVLVSALGLDA